MWIFCARAARPMAAQKISACNGAALARVRCMSRRWRLEPGRAGLLHMSKEFEEEFFLPSGEFHFSRGRSWIWMGFEDVERHTPNERQVLRRMVLARPGIIFVEDDIQRPMKLVFDAPMLPNDFHQFARRLALRQRHIVDGCCRRPCAARSPPFRTSRDPARSAHLSAPPRC